MNKKIEAIRKKREYLLSFVNDLTIEQLNSIPYGFNNNIIWNLGHLLAAQQGVCYSRASLKLIIEETYYTNYKTGTKPQGYVDNIEIQRMKELFLSVIEQLEVDIEKGIFDNYSLWTNRYGVEVANINDAMDFVLFHEGLHLGYIMALKRIVKTNPTSESLTQQSVDHHQKKYPTS